MYPATFEAGDKEQYRWEEWPPPPPKTLFVNQTVVKERAPNL